MTTVSSETLAKVAGVKPTQLRKDVAYFGQFGTRGLGYNVETLAGVLDHVLGTARLQPVILVGVGNLGAALLRYGGFQKEGFEITAAFDADPDTANLRNIPFEARHVDTLEPFIREQAVKMAILAVPEQSAQEVANRMVEAGIQAILNFSPTVIQVPKEVVVNHVDLALELENLSFFIR